MYVCSRAWLSALFNSVEAGWLGPRLANGCSGDFGWGAAIAPSYRFPHEGLPYHPSPERSPFFSHPRDTLPLSPSPSTHPLPSPPPPPPSPRHPLLSYPPSARSCNIQPRGRERWGASKILSHTNAHAHKLPECTCVCVCMCVRTLNLPKQFFQCNWAWGTCVHEIAQPLLHASCSGVYVPLLALQCRQLPNHILTGVFERLLSTRERERE